MKATSESSSNLGLPISMRDVLIRVWDQGYQSPHFRRSRFRPDGITFRITIACRQFPYSAAFTTNINWKKSRLEKFRMSYLRSTTLRINQPSRPDGSRGFASSQHEPTAIWQECRCLSWQRPELSLGDLWFRRCNLNGPGERFSSLLLTNAGGSGPSCYAESRRFRNSSQSHHWEATIVLC